MATGSLLNFCPNDTQLSAINELIEQQRDLLNALESVKMKNEENRAQLSEKALCSGAQSSQPRCYAKSVPK